jgi:glycosyltransferase involved in cell wall biosynthesis
MPFRRLMMTADAVGGVWTYALELSRGLLEQGVQTLLVTLGAPPDAAQRRAAAQVHGLVLEHGDFPSEWMDEDLAAQERAGAWLLDRARHWQPDVVHLNHYCHGHLPWPAPSLVVAHSCGYSSHAHAHGTLPGPRWGAHRDAVTRGLRHASLVVAPTYAMLAHIERLYGPLQRRVVIHNGRRPEDYPPAPKRERVLAAARHWDAGRNVDALVDVAARIDWPLAVAGDTGLARGHHEDKDGLQWLGHLDRDQMAEAYAEAGIYVLPAHYEPFGMSVLEAAFSGCALVLGNIASLRELWRDAALFVPPGDREALAAAIGRMTSDATLRARMAQRAHRRALRYTAARMTRRYLDAYAALTHREAVACAS